MKLSRRLRNSAYSAISSIDLTRLGDTTGVVPHLQSVKQRHQCGVTRAIDRFDADLGHDMWRLAQRIKRRAAGPL